MGQFVSFIKRVMKIADAPLGIPEIFTQESDMKAKNCLKPHEYIPVDKFTMDSLPEQLRDDDTFKLVKTIAKLTVKIISPRKKTTFEKIKQKVVSYVKKIRIPILALGQNNQGALNINGKDASDWQSLEGLESQYGSGRVAHVKKATDEDALKCLCPKCKRSNSNNKDLWVVQVFTATHVVPDTAAAKQTKCVLFYDNDTLRSGRDTQSIYGTHVKWNHEKGDLCFLTCVTCDSDLVDKLQLHFKQFNDAWKKMRSRAELRDCRKLLLTNCPIVIVSHPHGESKKISFGQIENLDPPQSPETKELQMKREYTLKYKACTCPGSSGAPVYVFGMNYFKLEFVHSGAKDYKNKEKNFNYSTKWLLEDRDLQED